MNNNRAIPDPSTLVNQYQMMPPKPPQQQNSNLPGLQLPGLPPTRPNLPQNDGANDDDHLTTEVYLLLSILMILFFFCLHAVTIGN
jgi:hypothetical protein